VLVLFVSEYILNCYYVGQSEYLTAIVQSYSNNSCHQHEIM